MSHEDQSAIESAVVTIRSHKDPAVSVRLLDRQFPDEDETVFSIDAHADGLHAHIHDVPVYVWDHEYLSTFLEGLAADFRGWAGERTWNTNHLGLKAVFRSGGHVGLTWILRPWSSAEDSWQVSVTTWLEAGEQMSGLAADVRAFLNRRP